MWNYCKRNWNWDHTHSRQINNKRESVKANNRHKRKREKEKKMEVEKIIYLHLMAISYWWGAINLQADFLPPSLFLARSHRRCPSRHRFVVCDLAFCRRSSSSFGYSLYGVRIALGCKASGWRHEIMKTFSLSPIHGWCKSSWNTLPC